MTRKKKMSAEGSELLRAVRQMNARKKGRVYTPEQLLAISARQSVNLTQKEFAHSSVCRLAGSPRCELPAPASRRHLGGRGRECVHEQPEENQCDQASENVLHGDSLR